MSAGQPRVFDGTEWSSVLENEPQFSLKQRLQRQPMMPVFNGNGQIFVSIPNFRDGKRCGETIASIFEAAQNPDQIIVGVMEQNHANDKFCIESYCEMQDKSIYSRKKVRADAYKLIAEDSKSACPRIKQIRSVAFHNLAAKGPVYARSLTRKVVGDEEFCLQVDAHTRFAKGWDDKLKHQWAAARNEFGIISTVPASIEDMEQEAAVPRQCGVQFTDTRVPAFQSDGKVESISKPLLSHAWSAGFSFSKCHLEETAPYDPFMPYVVGVEQFVRFARFWTRGYDVYTPTENIVFHDLNPQPEGHGTDEWMEIRDDRLRRKALDRARSILQLPDGDDQLNLNNLGLYGLGNRRTLKQLADFVGLDMDQGLVLPNRGCANDTWVPYDANTSPMENLFSNPNDLEPQPEFVFRMNPTFSWGDDDDDVVNQDGDPSSPRAAAARQANRNPVSIFWNAIHIVDNRLVGVVLRLRPHPKPKIQTQKRAKRWDQQEKNRARQTKRLTNNPNTIMNALR
eukprot:CAMPEP_0119557434 /NCGR_PEP_ID=MMETSP1352-20130426/9100_1 /TAXON_ID=265584 /ORGANISM="Stauroneis constricta, Strain CCMP1120" /LENGTH=510 /DNA_ID=CAMNT_0007604541 /DNA_START=109 /DNA_END=1637 /DNA_ORIENTATION=-